MIRYVDTSAALKLLVEERESAALSAELDATVDRGHRLVASFLLVTELHCAARRRGSVIDPAAVTSVLDGLVLVDLQRTDLLRAASSEWGLRSADALHLATALRVESDEIVTYDGELAEVATRIGLPVVAPG